MRERSGGDWASQSCVPLLNVSDARLSVHPVLQKRQQVEEKNLQAEKERLQSQQRERQQRERQRKAKLTLMSKQ